MGFFKNIIGNAVGDGISKGIKSAVSGAVEKAVNPVAEKWANKTAEDLDKAAEATESNIKETNNAYANLQRAAENYAATMEKAAKEAEANLDAANNPNYQVTGDYGCFTDEWNVYLGGFPEWTVGGTELAITELTGTTCTDGSPYCVISGDDFAAYVSKYLELLLRNGFIFDEAAGSYKREFEGTRYTVDVLGVQDNYGKPAIGFSHECID